MTNVTTGLSEGKCLGQRVGWGGQLPKHLTMNNLNVDLKGCPHCKDEVLVFTPAPGIIKTYIL